MPQNQHLHTLVDLLPNRRTRALLVFMQNLPDRYPGFNDVSLLYPPQWGLVLNCTEIYQKIYEEMLRKQTLGWNSVQNYG